MSGHLNPWGLLEFQQDVEQPAASVIAAAEELWRLAEEHQVNVPMLLARGKDDKTLAALEMLGTENVVGDHLHAAYSTETTADASADGKSTAGKPPQNSKKKPAEKNPPPDKNDTKHDTEQQ